MLLTSDPGALVRARRSELQAAFERVLDRGWFILGPEVESFEIEFAAWHGLPHAIGVANGTDALELALRAAGLGPGDTVLTAANAPSATATAILATGARLALADICPHRLTLDPASAARLLPPGNPHRIRALVPVHLYGHPADLPPLLDLAAAHGLTVIEDCAQAHGAALGGRLVGTFGHAAAFSFYPTKNLGALGDAGAVLTSDPALAQRVRELRQYGWQTRYVSASPGHNSRLDSLQAAFLRVLLPHLAADNDRRRALAQAYLTAFAQLPLALPATAPGATHVFHQFVLHLDSRDTLRAHLEAAGIQASILYPVPLHRQPAFASTALLDPAGLPATASSAARLLCLPLHPFLSPSHQEKVIAAVREFLPPRPLP